VVERGEVGYYRSEVLCGGARSSGEPEIRHVAKRSLRDVMLSTSLVILSRFAPLRIALSIAKRFTVNCAKDLRVNSAKNLRVDSAKNLARKRVNYLRDSSSSRRAGLLRMTGGGLGQ